MSVFKEAVSKTAFVPTPPKKTTTKKQQQKTRNWRFCLKIPRSFDSKKRVLWITIGGNGRTKEPNVIARVQHTVASFMFGTRGAWSPEEKPNRGRRRPHTYRQHHRGQGRPHTNKQHRRGRWRPHTDKQHHRGRGRPHSNKQHHSGRGRPHTNKQHHRGRGRPHSNEQHHRGRWRPHILTNNQQTRVKEAYSHCYIRSLRHIACCSFLIWRVYWIYQHRSVYKVTFQRKASM